MRYWPEGVFRGSWQAVDQSVAVKALTAIDSGIWPLLLVGCVGSGKSVLAVLLARQNPNWRFYETSKLLTTIMAARTSDTKHASWRVWPDLADSPGQSVDLPESMMLSHVENAAIVVLDDVGTRKLTEPQADLLLQILNARMNRPTIITTNCDRATLTANVGDRNASRLVCGSIVKFPTVDRRQSK